jgi:hypothetical protein
MTGSRPGHIQRPMQKMRTSLMTGERMADLREPRQLPMRRVLQVRTEDRDGNHPGRYPPREPTCLVAGHVMTGDRGRRREHDAHATPVWGAMGGRHHCPCDLGRTDARCGALPAGRSHRPRAAAGAPRSPARPGSVRHDMGRLPSDPQHQLGRPERRPDGSQPADPSRGDRLHRPAVRHHPTEEQRPVRQPPDRPGAARCRP